MNSLPRKRIILPIILCLTITFLLLAVSGSGQAASKASLSKKSVKLKMGKTTTLKVRHASRKVKWSTTNKKIARIKKRSGKRKQKVVIKAGKKAGTCYIKAKIGKKTLKCKVTVKKKKKTGTTESGPGKPGEFQDKTPVKEPEYVELSDSSRNISAGLTPAKPENVAPSQDFIKGFTGFSLELLKQSIAADRKEGKKGNVLISPDSVATALAMTENGASGQTLEEMETVLSPGLDADDYNKYLSSINRRQMASDALIYRVSNSIWAKDGTVDVKEHFLQKNLDYHDAEFYLAPFDDRTVADMNHWVYNKTRNMIDKIIDRLSEDARMVLINAVAFEGQWEKPFNESAMQTQTFTAADQTKRQVTMLRDLDDYQYLELKGGKGFVKYYGKSGKGGEIAFVGLLPPKGTDADSFIQTLDADSFLNAWNSKKSKRVDLSLPKFKYDYSVGMEEILKTMGMETAFTDGADFSGISDPTPETPGLKISKVLHKTHIEVDENGSKAAAATAVVMEKATAIMGDEPIKLTFDRPFVYALVDTKTGIPLFIGEYQ